MHSCPLVDVRSNNSMTFEISNTTIYGCIYLNKLMLGKDMFMSLGSYLRRANPHKPKALELCE